MKLPYTLKNISDFKFALKVNHKKEKHSQKHENLPIFLVFHTKLNTVGGTLSESLSLLFKGIGYDVFASFQCFEQQKFANRKSKCTYSEGFFLKKVAISLLLSLLFQYFIH